MGKIIYILVRFRSGSGSFGAVPVRFRSGGKNPFRSGPSSDRILLYLFQFDQNNQNITAPSDCCGLSHLFSVTSSLKSGATIATTAQQLWPEGMIKLKRNKHCVSDHAQLYTYRRRAVHFRLASVLNVKFWLNPPKSFSFFAFPLFFQPQTRCQSLFFVSSFPVPSQLVSFVRWLVYSPLVRFCRYVGWVVCGISLTLKWYVCLSGCLSVWLSVCLSVVIILIRRVYQQSFLVLILVLLRGIKGFSMMVIIGCSRLVCCW